LYPRLFLEKGDLVSTTKFRDSEKGCTAVRGNRIRSRMTREPF